MNKFIIAKLSKRSHLHNLSEMNWLNKHGLLFESL